MLNFSSFLVTSFLVTLLSTPFVIKISHKTNLMDHPADDPLKIHRTPIPVLGGLGILSGIIISLLLGLTLFNNLLQNILGLMIALLILFIIGLADDSRSLKPWTRILGQLFAALIVIFLSGFAINLIPHRLTNTIITIFYLLGAINAINLIDGIDGLATGITLVASASFLIGFIFLENTLGIILSLSLIGVCSGFLLYNTHPAKIFLGDNGSTLLGFLLGILAVLFTSTPSSLEIFLFPLLVLIVPILDTSLAIYRRVKIHTPLSLGDRDHLYDKLIKKGLSQNQTTFLMCSFGIIGGLSGIYLITH